MRALMERERPASGFWDLKLSRGGLVDVEFAAQHLQLIHAANGGPLLVNTESVLAALQKAGLADAADLAALETAWRLQQNLSQLLKVALEDNVDPGQEPAAFRGLLVKAGGARDFRGLRSKLEGARKAARGAFERLTR
jgi:glutamate-ammonia-ligase adenylyltransferase